MTDQNWFEYLVRVQPHHTDYAGVVWHGTYIAWMEEARVEYLRSHQLNFATWVEAGVDLPVVDLSLRYRQSLRLDESALVRARPELPKGIRMLWHYDIQNQDTGETCVVATVTLAPVDARSRKILRRLPPQFEEFLQSVASG